MHLTSEYHKSRLHRLARKHTVVLRKIRAQQRQEQRDIENKWKEDKPEEFKTAVSRYSLVLHYLETKRAKCRFYFLFHSLVY